MDTIEICNLALGAIGAPTILNFDAAGELPNRCRELLPVCRDRLLRSFVWSFSLTSAPLQQDATAPAVPEFPIGCQVPGDMIRAFRLESRDPYLLRGRRIFVAKLPQSLVYCRRIEDTSLFDTAFADALVYAIAAELAIPATRDANLANYLRGEFRERIAAARDFGAIENHHEFQLGDRYSSFLEARRGE